MAEKLHPAMIAASRTEMELGCGPTDWFGLAVQPTPERGVAMEIEYPEPGQKMVLEMSAQDATQIIQALAEALYGTMGDPDAVLIDRWEKEHPNEG